MTNDKRQTEPEPGTTTTTTTTSWARTTPTAPTVSEESVRRGGAFARSAATPAPDIKTVDRIRSKKWS